MLPWWLRSKESVCQCRRYRFNPWVGKTKSLEGKVLIAGLPGKSFIILFKVLQRPCLAVGSQPILPLPGECTVHLGKINKSTNRSSTCRMGSGTRKGTLLFPKTSLENPCQTFQVRALLHASLARDPWSGVHTCQKPALFKPPQSLSNSPKFQMKSDPKK